MSRAISLQHGSRECVFCVLAYAEQPTHESARAIIERLRHRRRSGRSSVGQEIEKRFTALRGSASSSFRSTPLCGPDIPRGQAPAAPMPKPTMIQAFLGRPSRTYVDAPPAPPKDYHSARPAFARVAAQEHAALARRASNGSSASRRRATTPSIVEVSGPLSVPYARELTMDFSDQSQPAHHLRRSRLPQTVHTLMMKDRSRRECIRRRAARCRLPLRLRPSSRVREGRPFRAHPVQICLRLRPLSNSN